MAFSNSEIAIIVRSLKAHPQLYYDVFVNPSFTYNRNKWTTAAGLRGDTVAISDPSYVPIIFTKLHVPGPTEWKDRLMWMYQIDVPALDELLTPVSEQISAAKLRITDPEVLAMLNYREQELSALFRFNAWQKRKPRQPFPYEKSYFEIQKILAGLLKVRSDDLVTIYDPAPKGPGANLLSPPLPEHSNPGENILLAQLTERLRTDQDAQKLFDPILGILKSRPEFCKEYEEEYVELRNAKIIEDPDYFLDALPDELEDLLLHRMFIGNSLPQSSSAAAPAIEEPLATYFANLLEASIIAEKADITIDHDLYQATRDHVYGYLQLYLNSFNARLTACTTQAEKLICVYAMNSKINTISNEYKDYPKKYDVQMSINLYINAMIASTFLLGTDLPNTPNNRQLFEFVPSQVNNAPNPQAENNKHRRWAYLAWELKDLSGEQLREMTLRGKGTDLEAVAWGVLLSSNPLITAPSIEDLQSKFANGTITYREVTAYIATERAKQSKNHDDGNSSAKRARTSPTA